MFPYWNAFQITNTHTSDENENLDSIGKEIEINPCKLQTQIIGLQKYPVEMHALYEHMPIGTQNLSQILQIHIISMAMCKQ